MKKSAIGIISILVFVVLASGCTSEVTTENKTTHFEGNGTSFDYPSNWIPLINTTNERYIVAKFGDPNQKINDSISTAVIVEKASGLTVEDGKSIFRAKPNYEFISEKTITIANTNATELIFKTTEQGIQLKYRTIMLTKNGFLYAITFYAKTEDFEGQNANFDMIINSFQIQ
ncbi:MAG: hypothetical protein FJ150_07960 [Euryarchaeota archaeon]|nr:hypothetical protein [Euryarchaeota archaeon]